MRVAATSVNPIDIKRRSGEAKAFLPIKFPGIVGVDVAGTVIGFGDKVTGFSSGDHVFGMADQTYAELCVVKASNLMKIPGKIDTVDAAALPLVTTTGYQLITNGIPVQQGQTVLVTGALGNVGRSAVFTARSLGARVLAGVRKAHVAEASALGVDGVIAIDDEDAVASLKSLDAVADYCERRHGSIAHCESKARGNIRLRPRTPAKQRAISGSKDRSNFCPARCRSPS